jgi:hypothetical protein
VRNFPYQGPLLPIRTNSLRQSRFRISRKPSRKSAEPQQSPGILTTRNEPSAQPIRRGRIFSLDASRLASITRLGSNTASDGSSVTKKDENKADPSPRQDRSGTVIVRPLPPVPPVLSQSKGIPSRTLGLGLAVEPGTSPGARQSQRNFPSSMQSPAQFGHPPSHRRVMSLDSTGVEEHYGHEAIARFLSSVPALVDASSPPPVTSGPKLPSRSSSPSLPPPPRARRLPNLPLNVAGVMQAQLSPSVSPGLGSAQGHASEADSSPPTPSTVTQWTVPDANKRVIGGDPPARRDEKLRVDDNINRTGTSSTSSPNIPPLPPKSDGTFITRRATVRASLPPLPDPPTGPTPVYPMVTPRKADERSLSSAGRSPSNSEQPRLYMKPSLSEFAGEGRRSFEQQPSAAQSMHSGHSDGSNLTYATANDHMSHDSRNPSRQNSISGRSTVGTHEQQVPLHLAASPPVTYGQHLFSTRPLSTFAGTPRDRPAHQVTGQSIFGDDTSNTPPHMDTEKMHTRQAPSLISPPRPNLDSSDDGSSPNTRRTSITATSGYKDRPRLLPPISPNGYIPTMDSGASEHHPYSSQADIPPRRGSALSNVAPSTARSPTHQNQQLNEIVSELSPRNNPRLSVLRSSSRDAPLTSFLNLDSPSSEHTILPALSHSSSETPLPHPSPTPSAHLAV